MPIEALEALASLALLESASTIKRKIDRRLGQRARFRDEEKRPAEELLEDMRNRPPDEKEEAARQKHEELAALPEVQEQMQEMAEAHWKSWLDKPLPILRHQTPREAAKTATGRERLEALFWQFESKPTGGNAFAPDIPGLNKSLGMI